MEYIASGICRPRTRSRGLVAANRWMRVDVEASREDDQPRTYRQTATSIRIIRLLLVRKGSPLSGPTTHRRASDGQSKRVGAASGHGRRHLRRQSFQFDAVLLFLARGPPSPSSERPALHRSWTRPPIRLPGLHPCPRCQRAPLFFAWCCSTQAFCLGSVRFLMGSVSCI